MNTALNIPFNTLTVTEHGIAAHVKKIIADKLGVEEHKVRLETSFADDLGTDSLDIYEMTIELEKEFRISIPDENIEKFKTVGSIINYISKQKS